MKWARVINAVAVDVTVSPPSGLFAPALAAQFSEVPDSVDEGFVLLPKIVDEAIVEGQSEWMPPRSYVDEFDAGRWRYVEPAAPPAPVYAGAAPAARLISRLAFLNRFTDDEAVNFDLASIGATAGAAALRRYVQKVNAAEFIDLDRADTRAGVIALEDATMLGPGRALEILDNPIQAHETYRG